MPAMRTPAAQDWLTGTRIRAALMQGLEDVAGRVQDDRIPVALLLIDLDAFAQVNDRFGVDYGDQVLCAVADLLDGMTPRPDLIARSGDDEFALLVPLGRSIASAAALGESYVAALRRGLRVGGREIHPLGSIGMAVMEPADTAVDLLRQAGAALRRAKARGGNCVCLFDPAAQGRDEADASLEMDLRKAVEDDEIEPFFQPLIDLRTRTNVGFEMFARWNHPRRGMIPPGKFIGLAERSGLIMQLTANLLRKACTFAATWPRRFTLAVNLSLPHLHDPELPAMIRRILAETGFEAERLELEIVEAAVAGTFDLRHRILELSRTGAKLVLDDFGSSFSSLRNLRKLPIHKLKIDHGFVRGASDNAEGLEVLRGLVMLGRTLGIPTVAEGVEDEMTLQIVELAGCAMAQGWHFAKPMPAPRQPAR